MKKILFLVFVLALIFSSCAKNEPVNKTSGYDMLGDTKSEKTSLGNYYIYTPIIDIFTPSAGEELSFLDFDGTKLIMDSGTDKAFLLSYDLYDGKTENLTNKLGFHSSKVVFDGDNYYYIYENEDEPFLIHKNYGGELIEEIPLITEEADFLDNDYVLPKINYRPFKDGKNIVIIKESENGGIGALCYNTVNGEISESYTNYALSGHETIPIDGYITYVEKNENGFSLFAFKPSEGKQYYRGPSSDEMINFSAFDGKNFVWSTDEGIFYKPRSGKTIQIDETGGKFAYLAKNFIYWFDEYKNLCIYRIDNAHSGNYEIIKNAEFVFVNENIAVFKNLGEDYEEKYISLSVKRGEEPLELKEAADEAPFTIAVDGYLYYCFFEESGGIVPTEKQISGKITSLWSDSSTCPRKNDQANGSWFFGARYAFVGGELLLENINGIGWYKCKKSSPLSELNLD